MKVNQKSQASESNFPKIILGINLGNYNTTVYLSGKHHSFRTQITIDLGQQQVFIGHKSQNLQTILEEKKKQLKQGQIKGLNQTQSFKKNIKANNPSFIQKRIIDILDLFVKFFTHRKIMQKRQKQKISPKTFFQQLPKAFSYYPYEFQQVKDVQDSVQIKLQKNVHHTKNTLIIREEKNKNKLESLMQNQTGKDVNNNNTIRVDQCLHIFLKEVLTHLLIQHFPTKQIDIKDIYDLQIVINHYGYEGNPFLVSLQNSFSTFQKKQLFHSIFVNQVTCSFIHSTTSLAIYYYLQHFNQNIQKSIIIGSLDFGQRGCSFSLYKIYPSSQKVIETLQHFSIEFGSIDITRILMDFIIQNVKAQQGVNVKSTPDMIKELEKLANQTRLALNQSQKVYVRVQGYPLTQPYAFYVKRQTIDEKIKTQVFQIIEKISQLCQKYTNKYLKLEKMILLGSSCQIPLFKKSFMSKVVQKYSCQIINADKNWVSKGNYLYRSSAIVVLEKSLQCIILKGDEDFVETLVEKNGDIPVRLVKEMQFPRGELNYILKIFQGESIVGSYMIESQNLEWGEYMNFIVQKQQHKVLTIYSSKYLGAISMRGDNLCKPVKIKENFNISIHQNKLS